MAEAFLYGIGGGGPSTVLSAVTLSSNGTYYPSQFSVDGFSEVTVNVTDISLTENDKFLLGTISHIEDSNISVIPSSAFSNFFNLSFASFPNVISVGSYAFYNDAKLKTLYLPSVVSLDSKAIFFCQTLESVYAPNINLDTVTWSQTFISSYSFSTAPLNDQQFYSCINLKSINFGSYSGAIHSSILNYCTAISYIDFSSITGTLYCPIGDMTLLSVSFPNVLSFRIVESGKFYNHITEIVHYSLTSLYISISSNARGLIRKIITPNAAININSSAVTNLSFVVAANCTSLSYASAYLKYARFTNLNGTIPWYTITSCMNLETLILDKSVIFSSYGGSTFNNVSALKSLYLLSTDICTMTNNTLSYGFTNSSYFGDYASVYVLSSLVDTYKNATNWVTISDRITSYLGDLPELSEYE